MSTSRLPDLSWLPRTLGHTGMETRQTARLAAQRCEVLDRWPWMSNSQRAVAIKQLVSDLSTLALSSRTPVKAAARLMTQMQLWDKRDRYFDRYLRVRQPRTRPGRNPVRRSGRRAAPEHLPYPADEMEIDDVPGPQMNNDPAMQSDDDDDDIPPAPATDDAGFTVPPKDADAVCDGDVMGPATPSYADYRDLQTLYNDALQQIRALETDAQGAATKDQEQRSRIAELEEKLDIVGTERDKLNRRLKKVQRRRKRDLGAVLILAQDLHDNEEDDDDDEADASDQEHEMAPEDDADDSGFVDGTLRSEADDA